MFDAFSHRHTPCLVDNAVDKVILSRDGNGSSVMAKESQYIGRFSPSSAVVCGSIVEAIATYFVYSLRITPDTDKYCSLIKTNRTITVRRHKQNYDNKYNPVGNASFQRVSTAPAFVQVVTTEMRQKEVGLLSTTVLTALIQAGTDIKRPKDKDVSSPDQVVIDDVPYRADVIDTVSYPNLWLVQLSEDNR